MKITLIENALDFILSALEHAEKDEARSLKYAVLHLSDGVELILKEKLRREHWSLLFVDVNKANESAFRTGEFKSVDFEDCVRRLESISAIDVGSSADLLRKLRRIRNRLQHFEYTGTKDGVISILVRSWSFVLDFVHDHLPDVVETQASTIEKIKQLMINNESFVQDRLAKVQCEVDEFTTHSNAILQCPRCLQRTFLIPSGADPVCPFCRYSASPDEAVDEWCFEFFGAQDPKERYTDPVKFTCPECGRDTLIHQDFGDMNPPEPGWVCFNCGQTWGIDEIGFCCTCGNPYEQTEDDCGMCSDCWEWQIEHG